VCSQNVDHSLVAGENVLFWLVRVSAVSITVEPQDVVCISSALVARLGVGVLALFECYIGVGGVCIAVRMVKNGSVLRAFIGSSI